VGFEDSAKVASVTRQVIRSPDGRVAVTFDLIDCPKAHGGTRGLPVWQVSYDGHPMLLPSLLGLEMSGAAPLAGGFDLIRVTRRRRNRTWLLPPDQRTAIRDSFREGVIQLRENVAPHRRMDLHVRCYNEGAAIRYRLPRQPGSAGFKILRDLTEFRFPAGTEGYLDTAPEDGLRRQSIDTVNAISACPLTLVYPHGKLGCLLEAGGSDWPRMRLAPHAGGVIALLHGTAPAGAPLVSPWRALMVADCPVDLPGHSDLVLNLAEDGGAPETSGTVRLSDGRHHCTWAFTRFVVGAVCEIAGLDAAGLVVTPAHQQALPLIMTHSGWDETRYLRGEIGEYVVVARRQGAQWFVAGITGPDSRVLTVRFDVFLPAGAQRLHYRLHLLRDALPEEDGARDGAVTEVFDKLTADDKVRLALSANGGFVMRLEPVASAVSGAT
jgi:hypothetical protein